MKINVEKILSIEAKEFIKDANFAYDEYTNNLNDSNAHMIAQKTLLRINIIGTVLENIVSENEIQQSTMKLSHKIMKQLEDDIDYMYPNGILDENNSHLVMQLIKRTGEDLNHFLECFQQKYEIESHINYINIIKSQWIEYNKDIEYAYIKNKANEENTHIVLQGLLGKSEVLHCVLENIITTNDKEEQWKEIYMNKITDLMELLNSGYDEQRYYKNNGHDILSELINSLKVEIIDLKERESEENKEQNTEEKIEITEDMKRKFKNLGY